MKSGQDFLTGFTQNLPRQKKQWLEWWAFDQGLIHYYVLTSQPEISIIYMWKPSRWQERKSPLLRNRRLKHSNNQEFWSLRFHQVLVCNNVMKLMVQGINTPLAMDPALYYFFFYQIKIRPPTLLKCTVLQCNILHSVTVHCTAMQYTTLLSSVIY